MSKEATTAPALKALSTALDRLLKDEEQIMNQLSYLARELRKQKKMVRELAVSVEKIQQTFKTLPRAQVVSLKEYWNLRKLLPANKNLLAAANKKVKELEKNGKLLDNQLNQIRRDKQNVQKEINRWNKVIRFKRDE